MSRFRFQGIQFEFKRNEKNVNHRAKFKTRPRLMRGVGNYFFCSCRYYCLFIVYSLSWKLTFVGLTQSLYFIGLKVVDNSCLWNRSFIFLLEDIVLSFSKRRYRASLSTRAGPGTTVVTVRAKTKSRYIPVRYSVLSVNDKPYSKKTALFTVDQVTGSWFSCIGSLT